MSEDDPYLYPGTQVLRNRLGIREAPTLDRFERLLVQQRVLEGIPSGSFGLAHLRAIHRHLFQDVYDWAGEIRTVELAKGGSRFMPASRITQGIEYVHETLAARGYLRGLDAPTFAREAGRVIGDINHVHPFREGNGRTQLQYLVRLAAEAGHRVELSRLDPARWIEASLDSHHARYDLMARCIEGAITGPESPPRRATLSRSRGTPPSR